MTAFLLASALSLPPVMPVSDIERGQQGTCQTVFEEDTIEPFDFRVKGVMRNFLGPGKDLVLVRLLGDKPEFTGVVAGMSGSPCSIDGKLVGALAYAFASFAKEPIAGITPMNDMLEVMRLPEDHRPWRIGPPSKHPLAAGGGQSAAEDAAWQALREGKALPGQPTAEGLRPIATPLNLGGLHPKVRDHFAPWLQSMGFEPVAGGTGSGSKEAVGAGGPLRPGSAVAAVLVRGDVNIAATGTVTSVEGSEVLAFGHPFLGAGIISVPMAHAKILNTMASQRRSYKMSEPGPVIGEFTQDRLTAIGGFMGDVPQMIPVKGRINTPAGSVPFEFEVARDLDLSPRLVAMGIANALHGNVPVMGRGTVRLEGRVEAEGMEPVVVRSVNAAQRDSNLLVYAAIDMARTFATLWDSPFGPPPQLQLTFEATLEPEPVVEWIDAMHIGRGVARPGDMVEVAVRLNRDDGVPRVERFRLPIPRSWAGEEIELFAVGANAAQRLSEGVAGAPRPTSLEEVREWLSDRRPSGNLYLMATKGGSGMRAGVKSLPFLPGSVVATLSGDAKKQRRWAGLAWEERREQPGVVLGGVSSKLKVLPY